MPPAANFPNFRQLASGACASWIGFFARAGKGGRGPGAACRLHGGIFHRHTGWAYIFFNGGVCAGIDRKNGGARERGVLFPGRAYLWNGFSAGGREKTAGCRGGMMIVRLINSIFYEDIPLPAGREYRFFRGFIPFSARGPARPPCAGVARPARLPPEGFSNSFLFTGFAR